MRARAPDDPRTAPVEAVVAEARVPLPALRGTDRTARWGWHRLTVSSGPRGTDAEVYLGIERAAAAAARRAPRAGVDVHDAETAPDAERLRFAVLQAEGPPPPPSLPYKVDTSRPSLRTN